MRGGGWLSVFYTENFTAAAEQSDVPSECWLLSAYVHLRLHDYHTADKAARKGQSSVNVPIYVLR